MSDNWNIISIKDDGTVTFHKYLKDPVIILGSLDGRGENGVRIMLKEDVAAFISAIRDALKAIRDGGTYFSSFPVRVAEDLPQWGKVSVTKTDSFSGRGGMVRIEWEHRSVPTFDDYVWEHWQTPCFFLAARTAKALLVLLEG